MFLFGEEALAGIGAYDLDVEADVAELVDRYMPRPSDRSAAGAIAAVRTIVARQVLDDTPPAAWQAAQRLLAAGFDRPAVIRNLTLAVSTIVLDGVSSGEPHDPVQLVAALDALPLPSAAEVAEALLTVVREHPGIDASEHAETTLALLASRGNRRLLEPLVDNVLDRLIDGPLHWLAGDATLAFHDTVAGRTFTHRFNDAERELEFISVSVDLAGFQRFDSVKLADGSELEQVSFDRGHLGWHGPEGWLSAFQPGDLLAVTAEFTPPRGDEAVDAVISIELIDDELELGAGLATAVRAAYDDEQREHGLPVSAEELVVWLCHRHPELFRTPLPPLSDWFESAGLDLDGHQVAHDASVWRRDLAVRRIHQVMDLVDDRRVRQALGEAVEVLADPEAPVEAVRASLADCADPEALDVLADVLVPGPLDPDDEFILGHVRAPGHTFALVHRATAVARRAREVATAEYLACVLDERCAQPRSALAHLARAVEAQPRLGPLVERMGWYAFDQGDARGAMRWWQQLDAPHPAARTIAPFLTPTGQGHKSGRNDPCRCGSGRKFKQCHALRSDLPALPDRVGWLCRKAALWLEHSSGGPRSLLTDLAIAWVTGDPDKSAAEVLNTGDDEARMRLAEAFSDPILFDAALTEGGLWARFLHERGDLLPDDERLLATSWLTVERSVHEVVDVERGVSMKLRDLATGEVQFVCERSASQSVHQGERYCLRVVPDGESHQIIGGVFPVDTGREEAALDLCAAADPIELCAWAGALARPTRIVHRPGMIDEMFDRATIQAMLDELGDTDEATLNARLRDEMSRQMHARWFDESIPALGGLTPRQAAADPTRREQIERLLAQYEHFDERLRDSGAEGLIGGPMSYDTAALRRGLGLA